ncbi:MAG TPA: cardiolipin synthase [Syntrophomonadaceae bacterium]|nr:cardiolipin synthase [Syntrophomonadaceae bacterium]
MSLTGLTVNVVDILFVVNLIFALTVILFERRNPTATLTWVLALMFIPVAGFIMYLFIGQDLRKKRLFYLKEEEERNLYQLLQLQDENLHNHMLTFTNPRTAQYSDVIHLHLNSDQSLFTQDNQVQIFHQGEELFACLLERVRKASKHIHLQSYIIRNDALGRELVDILCAKAREGVQVRLLYDGMGCIRLPRKFFHPLRQAGGKVAAFFPPILPYINLRINYRNHRKICVIDGQEAFVGGFNVGSEYLGQSQRFGFWRDTHLLVKGSSVLALQVRFLLDWRYASGEDYWLNQESLVVDNTAGQTGIQIVTSGPDSKWTSIKHGYLKIINKAQDNVFIQSPYFVPDDTILEALKIASLSGVDVRLMIPGKKDHPFVHWASLSFVGELLEAGAQVFIYSKGFLHSKVLVSDGFASTVGTANMDIRSFRLNFEVNAFIYDNEIGRSLEAAFEEDQRDCLQLTLEAYASRPIRTKIKEAFSRLLSPLL